MDRSFQMRRCGTVRGRGPWSVTLLPLTLQHREHVFAAPPALEPQRPAPRRLLPKTQPPKKRHGRTIEDIGGREHPMLVQTAEEIAEQTLHRFGGIAAALV